MTSVHLTALLGLLLLCDQVTTTKIVVVGAGMAGISTTRYLLDSMDDSEVVLLEANPNRYGGRMWSFEVPGYPGKPCELGAMWVEEATDRRHPIAQFCRQHNISTKYFDINGTNIQVFFGDNHDIFANKDSDQDMDRIWSIFDGLDNVAASFSENTRKPDTALFSAARAQGSRVRSRIQQLSAPMQRLMEFIMEETESGPSDQVSARLWGDVPGAEDDLDLDGDGRVVPGGYKTVLDKLINMGRRKVQVQLGSVVNQISYGENGVTVGLTNGSTYNADYAVVTVPLGVLQQRRINFTPPIPTMQQAAIDRFGFGNVVKVLLVFSQVFWPINKTYFYFLPINSNGVKTSNLPRMSITNLHAVNGLPALLMYIIDPEAAAADTMSDADLQQQSLEVIRTIFSNFQASGATLSFFYRTRWRADPFVGGSYSYGKLGMQASDPNNSRQPLQARVFFAGEHVMFPEGPSAYVHGAYLSGIRAAKQIINEIDYDYYE